MSSKSKRFRAIALGCLAAALFAGSTTFGGDKTPTARAILDKAIVFHGGADRLGRDVALIRTEESEMTIDGDKIVLKSEWQYQPPDKRAFQIVAKIGALQLHVRMGIVGEKGWVKFGPAAAEDMPPEQIAGYSWEHNNHVKTAMVLVDGKREFDAGTPKSVRFDGRDAWEIPFTRKSSKQVVTLYFDKSTGQLIGDESEHVVPSMGKSEARVRPAKFRVVFNSIAEVDGMKMPGTMSIARDGVPLLEVRKVEVRVVDSIDPKLFVKPTE